MLSLSSRHKAKVFSRCPESKSGKFSEKDDDETFRSTLILLQVVFFDRHHIVECGVSVVFISHRSFQNLDSMGAKRLHTFVVL